ETVFHAAGAPDAGNLLSLGFAVLLWLLIYGVVAEETGRSELGLLAAAASAVGLYPAVNCVTAGPHALGDLAIFTSLPALFFPEPATEPRTPDTGRARTIACVLGGACAASSKISLVPLGALLTAAALARPRVHSRVRMAGIALAIWLLVPGALVAWTFLHTG